jgi:MFS family permease
VLPALAPNLLSLVLAVAVLGAANGALDVSMNSQAVAVEKAYARPIMSSFHAAFSFGGLAGALIGGLVASAGVAPFPHLAVVAALCATAAAVAYRALLPASADAADEGAPAFARPTRALLGLGVISFCVLLGEGAMSDWSAVYLDGTLGTGPGFAAAGYAAFSLTMAFGRLFGDGLAETFGHVRLVRACGALAAVGLGVALFVGQPIVALVGFACAGAGFSVVFPAALSAAGRTEGMAAGPALAAVSTAGYTGFLVGPPTIGFVAELVGLGGALFIVVGLSAAVVLFANAVRNAGGKAK